MRLRIFIIDDEESIRFTFKWHLESKGHEVIVAEDPLGCDVYQGCDCQKDDVCGDLYLVDYQMPTMNGLDFFEMIHERGCKTNPANKYIMSGNVTTIDMERVEKICCKVLQKPIRLKELDEIVEGLLKKINPERELTPLSVMREKAERYKTKKI